MKIQINIDRNIEGHEALAAQVSGAVQSALSRISEHITRVGPRSPERSRHATYRQSDGPALETDGVREVVSSLHVK